MIPRGNNFLTLDKREDIGTCGKAVGESWVLSPRGWHSDFVVCPKKLAEKGKTGKWGVREACPRHHWGGGQRGEQDKTS